MEKVITDSIRSRIDKIKLCSEPEELKKNLCPFFERGGCPECIACDKSEASLQECKELYLERITSIPMEIWNEEFERPIAFGRETVSPKDLIGIGINCNRCYMAEKCPIYKKDYTCGIDWGSDKPNTPTEFMDFLIGLQYERVKRQSVFEKVDGGVPDAGLSSEMDRLSNLIFNKANLNRERLSISVEANGPATPQSGGILSKLFGGGSLPSSEKPIAIPASPVSREDIVDVQEIVEDKPVKVPRQRKK